MTPSNTPEQTPPVDKTKGQTPPNPPVDETSEADMAPAERIDVFEATRPNGDRVRITRNIDTGEQSVEVLEGSADD